MATDQDFFKNYNPADMAPQPQLPSLFDMFQGAGSDPGSLIARPPEGWQSQSQIYNDAGFGNGWITGNNMENPGAYAHTMAGPKMPYGIDPFTDIEYGGTGQEGQTSGFTLRDRRAANPAIAQDLFGGRQFQAGNLPKDIPEQWQPWLAPALMRYFYNQGYKGQGGSGINAPWTQRYAPAAPKLEHPTWPGIANYDPWHRDLGSYPALYGG